MSVQRPSISIESPSPSFPRNAVHTQSTEDFNNSVSAVHSSVEWLFSNVIRFLDFKKNLKLGLSSVGKMYVVAALLRNAITCLYGNTASSFFFTSTLQIFTIIFMATAAWQL